MAYSEKVIDHYENPRNVGKFDDEDESVGTGMVGAPACGDVMRLQIKVGDDGVIEDADVRDVIRPRRQGAGRGLVVGVARWSSGCRSCGDHSDVTSATAARVEDSSTMALSVANAATRAWSATLLTARG